MTNKWQLCNYLLIAHFGGSALWTNLNGLLKSANFHIAHVWSHEYRQLCCVLLTPGWKHQFTCMLLEHVIQIQADTCSQTTAAVWASAVLPVYGQQLVKWKGGFGVITNVCPIVSQRFVEKNHLNAFVWIEDPAKRDQEFTD